MKKKVNAVHLVRLPTLLKILQWLPIAHKTKSKFLIKAHKALPDPACPGEGKRLQKTGHASRAGAAGSEMRSGEAKGEARHPEGQELVA